MATFQTTFFSHTLRRSVPLVVCLPIEAPPNVPQKEKVEPFKTLYLLHGFSEGHNCWLHGSNIEALSRQHNLAVVMPAGENSFYLDDEAREALYGKFIGEELISFTRKAFHLSHAKQDTSIGGLSMGGYGAIRNGLKYSCTFGAIMAFSSALITEDVSEMTEGSNNGIASYAYFEHTFGKPCNVIDSDVDCKALAKKLVESKKPFPQMYLACGSEDFLIEQNRSFSKFLKQINYPHTYIESPGVHDWVFWNEYIVKALDWYLKL